MYLRELAECSFLFIINDKQKRPKCPKSFKKNNKDAEKIDPLFTENLKEQTPFSAIKQPYPRKLYMCKCSCKPLDI